MSPFSPRNDQSGGLPAEAWQAEPVWVLDDPVAAAAGQALGIADRLGLPYRALPLHWTVLAHAASLSRRGTLLGVAGAAGRRWAEPAARGPELVISAGTRTAAVALWLRERFACRLVHCRRPPLLAGRFDLLVVPEAELGRWPRHGSNVFPVVAAPHLVSPVALAAARARWEERLDHLPHPRVALLVGGRAHGSDLQPALAHSLARHVARLAQARGGSVLAMTARHTGGEATDALAAALGRVMHIIHRAGEPGEDPYLGFLAMADTVIATADRTEALGEAAATEAAVFAALPELATRRQHRALAALIGAGQVKMLGDDLRAWPRSPLDEAGRVAIEIRRRFMAG